MSPASRARSAAQAAAPHLRLKPRALSSLQRQSLRRAATLVASLATLAARSALAQCPDGTPPPCVAPRRAAAPGRPPAEAQRRRSFLVLPFRNVSRAAEHEWLVEGSPILLADALSRWQELRVVPDERLYPALRRAGLEPGAVMDLARVRRVAAETGGWTAVTGDVLVVGGRIRVSARAYDAVTNREVVRVAEEVTAGEDVRAAYERIGAQLLRSAGLEAAAPDLAEATTRSLDAYRAYVRGISHANRSEARRARDAFREAVRLDSSFAQAYAKLAEAVLSVNPGDIFNPRSPAYGYAQRAAALADRLPPDQREVVLGMNDLLGSRFASARQRMRQLVERDSTHVDALEWLASIEGVDPILVPVPGGERPRGSWNTRLLLAKLVLELDPARHDVYQHLVQSYLVAGGGTPGFVPAYREEAGSLAALFAPTAPPARTFVPLLRDTVLLIPSESLATQPPDSVAAARQRAIAAARLWVTRWLAAGPTEAEPHLWASRVHDLAGDLDAALRELNAADSLGVETGLEYVPARRMALLARMGRHADGARIADSLWAAGALEVSWFSTLYQTEGLGWAYTLFVLEGRHDRAATLLERTAVMVAPANPELGAEALAVVLLSGLRKWFFAPPREVRLAVLERLLGDAGRLPPTGILARLLPYQTQRVLHDTLTPESRRRLGGRVVAAATGVSDTAYADLAFALAQLAAGDTAQRAAVESLPWFARRQAAARAERITTQRRFRPASAAVTDSVATFIWTAEGDSFAWYRVETAIGESDFRWTADFELVGKLYEVLAHVERTPGSTSRQGGLADLLGAARRALHEMDPDTTVPHRPVRTAVVRVEPQPGGFRVLLRDRAAIEALRRERPATVRFRFRPCEPDPATPCVDQRLPVTYP